MKLFNLHKIIDILWPIYGKEENFKFTCILLMKTLLLFVYTLLKINKEVFVLSVASANSISHVKAYLVFPFALLYMLFFVYLHQTFSRKKAFFISVLPFLIFFTLFYLIILPYESYFLMSKDTLSYLTNKYPSFTTFFPIIAYWPYTIFYVLSEIWSSFCIGFLFWQITNEIVDTKEAKRFYPLFSYSYIGLITASYVQGKLYYYLAFVKSSFEYNIAYKLNAFLIVTPIILFIILYCFVYSNFFKVQNLNTVKNKEKPSFLDGLKIVMKSKYLIYLAVMVICYGVITSFIELTWKEAVKAQLVDKNEIGKYLSKVTLQTGFLTIFMGILNKYLLNKFELKTSLLLTPIIIFVSSLSFLLLILFKNYSLFGIAFMDLAIQVGFIQNILAKSCKYAFFDPNIQMCYIPLDDNLKIKGKSAVDIVGIRAGKSGVSVLESIGSFLLKGANQLVMVPFFIPILFIFTIIWINSTFFLIQEYKLLLDKKKSEEIDK